MHGYRACVMCVLRFVACCVIVGVVASLLLRFCCCALRFCCLSKVARVCCCASVVYLRTFVLIARMFFACVSLRVPLLRVCYAVRVCGGWRFSGACLWCVYVGAVLWCVSVVAFSVYVVFLLVCVAFWCCAYVCLRARFARLLRVCSLRVAFRCVLRVCGCWCVSVVACLLVCVVFVLFV